jgi:hypothetical protein
MALVTVILNDTDHICCGPRREVGDTVTMQVHNYQGQVYEERHPGGVSIATQPMTGTIVKMEWRPAIMREEVKPEGFTMRTRESFGPARVIQSTDYDDPEASDWAFQFTLETDDPIPAPRRMT